MHVFLRTKTLLWIEALSLWRDVSHGVAAIGRFGSLLEVCSVFCIRGRLSLTFVETFEHERLTSLVRDVQRFIKYHKHVIENNPLQLYSSALLFSPRRSLLKLEFQHEQEQCRIEVASVTDECWGSCLLTLEGHSDSTNSVIFSRNSSILASASDDRTIKIWDAETGECMKTLRGHRDIVKLLAFSQDSTLLASLSWDHSIKIWNKIRWDCVCTINLVDLGHIPVKLSFLKDSREIVLGSLDGSIAVWDADSGECLHQYCGSIGNALAAAISPDGSKFATSSMSDGEVEILDVVSGVHSRISRSETFDKILALEFLTTRRSLQFWETVLRLSYGIFTRATLKSVQLLGIVTSILSCSRMIQLDSLALKRMARLRLGMDNGSVCPRLSRATVAPSHLSPSLTTRDEWPRHRMIKLSRSGIQTRARSSRRISAI